MRKFLVGLALFFAAATTAYFLGLAAMGASRSPCESAYITISAAEVCHQSPACKLTVDDVEKYLRARRVHGECVREGAYD